MNKKSYIIGVSFAITAMVAVSVVPAFAAEDQGRLGVSQRMMGQKENGQLRGNRGVRGMRPAVVGSVSAVNGTNITVASRGFGKNTATTTYSVDASSATIMKGNATSTISDIVVGDNVVIQGTVTGTSVKATTIRDGMIRNPGANAGSNPQVQGNGQPVVAGTVVSVSGSVINVTNSGNVTYAVDTTNSKFESRGQQGTSTISNVSVGDRVIAQGAVNGTSVTASLVIDQGNPSNVPQGGNGDDRGSRSGFFGSIGNFFKHLFGF